MDKNWILSQILYSKIKFIVNLFYIKSIGIATHFSKNFIYIFFNFFKINNDSKPVLAKIKREIYLIEGLKTKMLVSNDILISKKLVLDLSNKKAIIFSCNTKI